MIAEKPRKIKVFRGELPKRSFVFESRTFDHSDNPPSCIFTQSALENGENWWGELKDFFVFEPSKTCINQDFFGWSVPRSDSDFECCTFDHSDNSPCLFSSGFLSRNLLKNSLGRKQERKQKIFDFEIFRVEMHQRKSGGRKSQVLPKFRVSPVMTTSIPLRIADAAKLRRYYNSRQGKNQARIFLLHKSLACLTLFFVL